jgi:hypothetical protein
VCTFNHHCSSAIYVGPKEAPAVQDLQLLGRDPVPGQSLDFFASQCDAHGWTSKAIALDRNLHFSTSQKNMFQMQSADHHTAST